MARTGRCIVAELGDGGSSFSTITSVLGDADVNIDGFSAQAVDGGTEAYVVTEDVDRGRQALEEAGISLRVEPYVAATLTSRPGELARAMQHLSDSGIHPDAAFLVMTPWGPDIQVAFACQEPKSAKKALAELEA